MDPWTSHAVAHDIRDIVLDHIDTMYPGMWQGVASSARRSVGNTILRAVQQALVSLERGDYAPPREKD